MSAVVIVRPEPGLSATVASCKRASLPVMAAPMFEIEPVSWEAPDPAKFDALLIGSANAIRHGGDQLDSLRGLPAYCVGARTAEVTRAAGFSVAQTGEGGLQSLVDASAAAHSRFLRLSGEQHVTLDAREDILIEQRIVYRSRPKPMADLLHRTLKDGAIALLHSAEAARHFAAECDRLTIDRSQVDCALIGPRLAEAAGEGWRSIGWPEKPTDDALVAFAKDLWHNQM